MSEQSYANHSRIVPLYHYGLSAILLVALLGSFVALYRSFYFSHGRTNGAVVVLLVVASILLFWYSRVFALKAQDRAIRAEENFRHYLLTGAPLDSRLRVRQIVALRFASDDELPALAARAAEENLDPKAIKQAVQSWRPDHYRV